MNSADILRFARPVMLMGLLLAASGCIVESGPVRPRPVVVERPAGNGFCYYHPDAPACR